MDESPTESRPSQSTYPGQTTFNSSQEPEDPQGEMDLINQEPQMLPPRYHATILGACDRCKKMKMKCEYPMGEDTCRKCGMANRQCTVTPRKSRSSRSEKKQLLSQIRQKNAVILSLMKQLNNAGLLGDTSLPISDDDAIEETLGDETSGNDTDEVPSGEVQSRGSGASLIAPSRTASLSTFSNLSLEDVSVSDPMQGGLENGGAEAGVASLVDFRPTSDPSVRVRNLRGKGIPDIVIYGVVTPQDVESLFKIYHEHLNIHVNVLDPVLHTPPTLFTKNAFLFTVVCAVASRCYTEKPGLYTHLMRFAKHGAANALFWGQKSVELVQAYILLAHYDEPTRRWDDHRAWLYIGSALHIATALGLNQTTTGEPANELQERELLNRARVWLSCYSLDRSSADYHGRPYTIKDDHVTLSSENWYKRSKLNQPSDIALCAYTSMLRIVSSFRDLIYSNPKSPTGLNQDVNLLEVATRFDVELSNYNTEWDKNFASLEDSTLPDARRSFYQNLLLFLTSYYRLVMYSVVLQQAFKRGVVSEDCVLIEKCYENAVKVITIMAEQLAPSRFMCHSPDSHYIFATFTSAFLLKLLKPTFSNIITKDQHADILGLIHKLILAFNSATVAVDGYHTPRIHSRFLSDMVSKHGPATPNRQPSQLPRIEPTPVDDGDKEIRKTSLPAPSSNGGSADEQITSSADMLGALEAMNHSGFWENVTVPGILWSSDGINRAQPPLL